MKVFSREKFIQTEGWEAFADSCKGTNWVNKCNGKQVKGLPHNGACIPNVGEAFLIHEKWCIDVPDAVEETGKILNDYFPNGFPEPDPQALNCRCVCLTGKPTKHPRYKIVIECAADHTFAYMYVDDNLVKMESAKRNPADKFSWRVGAQTAFNRLWEKKKKPVKPVNKYAQLFNEKIAEAMKEEVEKIFRMFDKLPPVGR